MTVLHAGTGGGTRVDGAPELVFIHGAGMNHTGWAHQSRYFASRGWNVTAVDLPGHGDSEGDALDSVPACSEAVAADLDRRGIERATVVGHSMGAMIGLHLAATRPNLVERLALVGAGLALAVNPALLDATRDDPELAADAITDWGLSGQSHIGMAQSPGSWMDSGIRRHLGAEIKRHPGSLAADFAATAAFDGSDLAASVTCPVLVVSGSHDMMTPPKLGRAVVEAIPGTTYVELAGAGHMHMTERPKDLITALANFLAA